MDDERPAYRAQIQIRMFALGVPKHASGVDLTFAFTCLVQDGLFQLMMTIVAKHMALATSRNAAVHVAHKLRRQDLRGNCEPFTLASDVEPVAFGFSDHFGF